MHYRLSYTNLSATATVPGVLLIDSLPAGLDYTSATSVPTAAGGVLTWSVGALAPGASGTIDLVTTVAGSVQ